MLHLWWRERGETWDGWCSWMELERKVQETSPDGEAWHSAQRWEMPSDSTGGMITGNQVRFDALHRMRNCRKIIRLKFLFFLFFRNSIFVEIFESFPLCRHACIHSFIHQWSAVWITITSSEPSNAPALMKFCRSGWSSEAWASTTPPPFMWRPVRSTRRTSTWRRCGSCSPGWKRSTRWHPRKSLHHSRY